MLESHEFSARRPYPRVGPVRRGPKAQTEADALGAVLQRTLVINGSYAVRREKAQFPSGCKPRPATFAPAGSNRSHRGGNEAVEAFDVTGHESDSASRQAVTSSER